MTARPLNAMTWLVAVFGLIAFVVQTAAAASFYSVTDLGTLSGWGGQSRGINNGGEVVGYDFTEGYWSSRAFLYTNNGVMTDLGSFGGTGSLAHGINMAGKIVGHADIPGDFAYHAFLYNAGTMIDLGTLGGTNSDAAAINDNDQIVGGADLTLAVGTNIQAVVSHAFLYSGGTMTDLGTLGGSNSLATAINKHGQIVGWAQTAGNAAHHAFLYSNGQMTDLGTLGGASSAACAINDTGQILGMADTTNFPYGDSHPFIYSDGRMTDLTTLGATFGEVRGFNNNGQVVGWAKTSAGAVHAFLYSGGIMTDLNTVIDTNSGWTIYVAQAVNDLGQITGWGETDVLTPYRPVLLTKVSPRYSLQITMLSQRLLISWPTNAVGFGLCQSSNLTSVNWEAVTNLPVLSNGQYQVSVPNTYGPMFYRLVSQ